MEETRGTSLAVLDGRYELSNELGRGSTGTVWEARDRVSGETVAVKILEPHALASRSAKKRFAREVETATALRHPHVVEVRAHGTTADGGAYLVMERLIGKTLAARLRQGGPLPQPQAIRIVAQVLDAVLAAHRLGIVHRDLKPSNVMLIERDGEPDYVKVCDFGLAKDIDVASSDSFEERDVALAIDLASVTTEHGQICGTPEYMAPEQARGEPIDARADLYAVAVILYCMVAGRPPFTGRSPLAVVSLHLTAAPPRPSEVRPDLGIFPPLESLILRGLAKDRAERPSSAEVFRADLLQIDRDYARWAGKGNGASSSTVPVESETLPLAPTKGAPSHRGKTGVFLGATALSIVLFVAWWKDGTSSPDAAATLRPNTEVAPPAATRADARLESPRKDPPAAEPPPTPSATPPSERPSTLTAPKARKIETTSLLVQAHEALAAGRVVEACALGQTAAAAAPDSPAVWKFLGQCSMRLGERERGIAYYRRYLALAPSSPDAVFVQEMIK